MIKITFQERAIKNFSQADAEYGETIRKLIETKYSKKASVEKPQSNL